MKNEALKQGVLAKVAAKEIKEDHLIMLKSDLSKEITDLQRQLDLQSTLNQRQQIEIKQVKNNSYKYKKLYDDGIAKRKKEQRMSNQP